MHLWHQCPTTRASREVVHCRLDICLVSIDEGLNGGNGDLQLAADIHVSNPLAMQIDDLTFDVPVHLKTLLSCELSQLLTQKG